MYTIVHTAIRELCQTFVRDRVLVITIQITA